MSSLLDILQDEDKKETSMVQGVANAVVTNNKDPSEWGRV